MDLVSKLLQNKNMNLFDAVKLLHTARDNIKVMRNKFEEYITIAKTLATSWGSNVEFTNTRKGRTKKCFDELSEDQRLADPEQRFKVGVFFVCIDTAVVQLDNRFHGMNAIAERFCCLNPMLLVDASDDQLATSAEKMAQIYASDISAEFPSQLLSFWNALMSEIKKIKTGSISHLAELLLLRHSSIVSSVPDVATALKLFLTLPVTVASAERSFSKLKIIKKYLRSTMAQQRLSGLSILSIENVRARRLDKEYIVKEFAQKNSRRQNRFNLELEIIDNKSVLGFENVSDN